MIKHITFLLLLSTFYVTLQAQTSIGLVRYFSFDTCDGLDDAGSGVNALLLGNPQCGCGVSGNALEFDGMDDAVLIPGTESLFTTVDFTISFYYKSTSGGSQSVVSRKEGCDANNAFSIRVAPASNTIITQMQENAGKGSLFNNQLDLNSCWHHVVFVRRNDIQSLYLNGRLIEDKDVVSRVDLTSENTQLGLGNGPCLGIQDLPFRGLIDEFRLYNRALNENDIRDLTIPVDQILTRDTLIFLGSNVDIVSSGTCANSFDWFPVEGVEDISNPNTTLTPDETTIYSLAFNQGACRARDSIRISVIDPAKLDCEQLFMANAFTPNGDGNNDTYGISNPFALEEFSSIEIIDRWGARVYFSEDKFAKWDGTFNGAPLNPGVYLYRILYACTGIEQFRTGSVTMLR